MRAIAKNLTLLSVSCLLASLLGEGLVRGLDLFAPERRVIRDLVHKPSVETRRRIGGAQIHPFLGWTPRPQNGLDGFVASQRAVFPDGKPTEWAIRNGERNLFGYRSAIADYRRLPDEAYVVGVFGGSLAAQAVIFGGDALVAHLERRFPELRGRVAILNLAGGGYKQPQQVNTLIEMTALGVRFDLLLNVDGFNEVVFGGIDAGKRRHPIFPSHGHWLNALSLTTGVLTDDQVEKVAAIIRIQQAQKELAERARTSSWRASEAFHAWLGWRALRNRRESARVESALQQMNLDADAFEIPVASLEEECFDHEDGCWELIADIWKSGSLQMDALARRLGVPYLHFLQPSQYVPGSKVLSDEERRTAYQEESDYRRHVEKGYPLLRDRAEELQREGVRFHDLTALFADRAETLYSDPCCHLNLAGYRILARRIIRHVAPR